MFLFLFLYDTVNAREDFCDYGNKNDGGSNDPHYYLHQLAGRCSCVVRWLFRYVDFLNSQVFLLIYKLELQIAQLIQVSLPCEGVVNRQAVQMHIANTLAIGHT